MLYTTEGVILRVIDYRESDRLVSVFTRRHGRMTTMARHATKSRRRFGSSLNVFQLVQLKYRLKGQRALAFLEEVRPMNSLSGIYGDWHRIAVACLMVDLLAEMTREGLPNEAIYDAAYDALLRLNRQSNWHGILADLEYRLLRASGLKPSIETCVQCHQPGEALAGLYWVHEAGGLHCSRCLPPQLPFEIVSPPLYDALLAVAQGRGIENASSQSCAALLYYFTRHHLGHSIRSWEFLEQTGISPCLASEDPLG